MKIGFVVNKIETEEPGFTTTRLAMAAVSRGHESLHVQRRRLRLRARRFAARAGAEGTAGKRALSLKKPSLEKFLEALQSEDAKPERVELDEFDVLMLRNDPSTDAIERPWAQTAPILFGELAVGRGVLVVNDPEHLATALNKTYFQHFPGRSPAEHVHQPLAGRDQAVPGEQRREDGDQAAARLGRAQRVRRRPARTRPTSTR